MKLSFGNRRRKRGRGAVMLVEKGMKRWKGEREEGSKKSLRINQPVVMLS